MATNLKVFTGKVESADSTIMPAVNAWVTESLSAIPEVKDANDHAIVGWLSLPTCGVLGAQKWDFFICMICNLLSQNRKNCIVLIVHSNRAAQMNRSPGDRTFCVYSHLCVMCLSIGVRFYTIKPIILMQLVLITYT